MSTDINALLAQLDQMSTGVGQALTATNAQQFAQQVAEFNANYGNQQAQLYGYNTGTTEAGIQYPSPYAPTSQTQSALGYAGYIPGYSGVGAGQSLAGLSQNQQLAQQNANNSGFYNTPMNSAYTPGTFLTISGLDPSLGTQMDYVLPSGQLQRVSTAQAQAMGWNGQVTNTIPYSQAATLESAPPTSIPQETLAGQQQYMNLNTAAQQQALQQSQATGVYTQPGQIVAPGTNMSGSTFQSLPAATQYAYYYAHGGDWNAAMQAWVNDSNNAILQANPNAQSITQAGTPQETQAGQQQQYNIAAGQAGLTGMYSAPTGYPPGSYLRDPQTGAWYSVGQNGQAQYLSDLSGVPYNTTPISVPGLTASVGQQGQGNETLAAQQQFYNQALQQAGLTGYIQNPGTPGSPNSTSSGQETMQAQQQMFNEANTLGTEYGQYYSPLMPGQTGQAGVNTPQVGQITEQGREFNVNTASDLAKLASSLTGPANYYQYLQALNGGNSIINNLYQGGGQAGGGQVGSTGGTQSLDNILGQFGLSSGQLTGGVLPTGTYAAPNMGGNNGTSTGSQASSLGLPPPNQIQPTAYNNLSPSGQQFVQGAYQAAGYNPADLSWFQQQQAVSAGPNTPGVAGGGTSGSTSHFANPASQSIFA